MIKRNSPSLKLRRTKKGSVLVFALIILSFILVSAFSLASISLIERRSADISVNSATAFQNSDKGMEEFLQKLYKDLDQNDDLDELASQLDGYACDDGGRSHAARIGDETTKFIITAYKENPNPNPTNPDDNWNVVEIDDCATSLADVSRFRATGNHNNAARAVFLKLRDSLTRGLVAHWSFEDRAHVARVTPEADSENRISFLAQDYSKQNHTLTLCNIDQDVDDPLEITVIDSGSETVMNIQEFSPECSFVSAGSGMNPARGYNDNGDDEYHVDGAWREGIVEEILTTTGAHGDNSSQEALYFGNSTYLASYFDSSCGTDDVNCIEDSDDKLAVEDGIAISLWVKPSSIGASGYLVSKYNDSSDKGYELYLNSGTVCFRLNNIDGCASDLTLDDDWHHVVARWREVDGDMEVFVDGKKTNLNKSTSASIGDIMGEKIVIGAQSDPIGNYFTGVIDDVRIWNRALTCNEVYKLCNDAVKISGAVTCVMDACAT